ncbi:FAD-dependent oxidoreductase [Amycolatopsis sp. NPDC059021]|uniref:FAD-dependent oxidoreductase n=1 Tax=Amycolatopsis sp. NPDC059021 TaxID=3346704 RepID=UPI00367118AF
MKNAVVVGGGIGGLSAAVALHQAGWQVTVLERAPEFTEIGAGISLWPNAVRALETIGVGERLAPLLAVQRGGGLHDRRGRRLTHWDTDTFERLQGGPLTAVHRADLIDTLRTALPQDRLRTGAEVTEVRPDGRVRIGDEEIHADLVVAADGIRSRIRQALWPDHPAPVYCGATAIRGIAELPGLVELSTTWDRGTEVGVIPLVDGRVYWWAGYVTEPGIRHADTKAYLTARFGGWHAPIPAVIAATPPEALLHHDVDHLAIPLPSYVRGRIALLGDAAHAMPPFLGQGGCQAIEDAVVLAHVVSTKDSIDSALREYDVQRRARSQRVARATLRAGQAGLLLRNPVATALRAALLRVLPASAAARANGAITRWEPPRPPARPRTR